MTYTTRTELRLLGLMDVSTWYYATDIHARDGDAGTWDTPQGVHQTAGSLVRKGYLVKDNLLPRVRYAITPEGRQALARALEEAPGRPEKPVRLGTNQVSALKSLGGSYPDYYERPYPGGGWIWGNHSTTVKLLETLVKRGLVRKVRETSKQYTPEGPATERDIYQISHDGRKWLDENFPVRRAARRTS